MERCAARRSPFIVALERIGIPGAADVMNAIVATAVLSCLASAIYTASRMLFALARRRDARRRCSRLAIAAMVVVIASMALVKDARPQLIRSLIALAMVLVAARRRTRRAAAARRAPARRQRVPAT